LSEGWVEMTEIFNNSRYKDSRKYLRNHPTFTESILWKYLKGKQLCGYKFRRQYSVNKFILDFYCPKLKLAVEIDGITHENAHQREYDYKRQLYIESFSIILIRFSDDEILSNLDLVIEKTAAHIKRIESY
jgi:very-short-patch-repair endonuclease